MRISKEARVRLAIVNPPLGVYLFASPSHPVEGSKCETDGYIG